MSVKLELVSDAGTLNLNAVDETGSGIQATSGAAGFGLPAVDLQLVEGAGEGGSFRGVRRLSRDIDLPLYFVAADDTALRALVKQFSRVLRGEVTLRASNTEGDVWNLDCRRVGGGDFTWGRDRTQKPELKTVITLRAPFPYWASNTLTSATAVLGSGTIALTNDGDVEVAPTWVITGPGSNVTLTSEAGEVLSWGGTLTAGQVLTIDTRTGYVTRENGSNQYSDIAASPKFWRVPVGSTTGTVAMSGTDGSSSVVCQWHELSEMVV